MVEAAKLILIGNVGEAESALRLAPKDCKFAFSNQTSKKNTWLIIAVRSKQQLTTLDQFLCEQDLISSDDVWSPSDESSNSD